MSSTFQRARRPEHKEQRRAAIVGAARALAAEHGVQGVTLAAVADAVGLARSNVLRYFATREEIYLQLVVDEWTAANDALESTLAGRTLTLEALADLLASTIAGRPLFGDLSSQLAATLERGVPVDVARGYKLRIIVQAERLGGLLVACTDELDGALAHDALNGIGALVMGLWPAANPPPELRAALDTPESCHMLMDFEPVLRRLLHALLVGLVATA